MSDTNSNVAQSRNPPTTMAIFSSANAVQDMASNVNMSRPGGANQNMSAAAMEVVRVLRDKAKTSFLGAVQEYGSDAIIDAVTEPSSWLNDMVIISMVETPCAINQTRYKSEAVKDNAFHTRNSTA